MNINRYALCKERSLQKIISKQPKPNTTAIGVCSETQVTHHIITKRSDECLPISAYVPKHKEGDGKKFPVIIDIYGGDFVAGRSALNRNFGTWCAGWRPRRYLHHQHKAGIAGKAQAEGSR